MEDRIVGSGDDRQQITVAAAGRTDCNFGSDIRVGCAVAVDHVRGHRDDTRAIRGRDHWLFEFLRVVGVAAVTGCGCDYGTGGHDFIDGRLIALATT